MTDNVHHLFPGESGRGGGGPEDPMLEARVGHLEDHVREMRADIREIRTDIKDTRQDVGRIEERLARMEGGFDAMRAKLDSMPTIHTHVTWLIGTVIAAIAMTFAVATFMAGA